MKVNQSAPRHFTANTADQMQSRQFCMRQHTIVIAACGIVFIWRPTFSAFEAVLTTPGLDDHSARALSPIDTHRVWERLRALAGLDAGTLNR